MRVESVICGCYAYNEMCVYLLWLQCVHGEMCLSAAVTMRTRTCESIWFGFNLYKESESSICPYNASQLR
ncbi:hypothetical protein DPMN_122352 [Dreissena polymorpha]|uniref:Uncharacterized protein n=1 Tax=Dreissena polymorpha TaxID=45954 RepID=A0A9D4GVB9_DREPO|nr:hypothetical protein DPMN_122352 [Dreissena polymorpha]